MSILTTLFSNEGIKKKLFESLAKTAKEKGIKKMFININDEGNFDMEVIDENKIICDKKEYDFLKTFFENNKTLLT